MNKIRPIILAVAVILAGILAYGVFKNPLFGFLSFSKTGYVIFNVLVSILFLLVFALDGIRGRLKAPKVFKVSASVLGLSVAVLALGELMAYICSVAAGVEFKPFGTISGVGFANLAMIISTAVFFVITVWGYMILRGRAVQKTVGSMRASASVAAASKYACTTLYGTLTLTFFLSAVLLIALGKNSMLLLPLCIATAGLWIWRLTGCRFMLVLAICAILLHAFPFLQTLVMDLTIGAYGVVAMIAFFDFMVLVPLADLYLMPERNK